MTDTISSFKTNFYTPLSACRKVYGGYKTNWTLMDALMNLELKGGERKSCCAWQRVVGFAGKILLIFMPVIRDGLDVLTLRTALL